MHEILAVVAALLVVLGLASGVMRASWISAPMVALTAGIVFGPGLGILPTDLSSGGVLLLAEVGLGVLLFVDATRVDPSLARRDGSVPVRMLAIGLPLAIALGTVVGVGVVGLGLGAAFVLACILVPTDAALGQAVMADQRIPARVRQAINVESGLNDGLAAPFLVVALAVADARSGTGVAAVAREVLGLVGGGLLVGAAVGGTSGWLLQRVGWQRLQPAARQVGVGAVPVLALGLADVLGGNGFVAAFVAGLAFSWTFDDAHRLVEFGEDAGDLLSLLTFLAFGAVFTGPAAEALSGRVVLYAALSLTVVRMVPVAVSLLGLGLRRSTVGLLGWFGPRGLASIVFGLEVLELAEAGSFDGGEQLFGVASVVVVASVFLHGLSARPLAGAYVDRLHGAATASSDAEGPMAELVDAAEFPFRRTVGRRDT